MRAVVALVALSPLVFGVVAPAAPGVVVMHGPLLRLGNWAGYVAHGGHYTSVSVDWTEPTLQCPPGHTSYSSNWAGLDGYGSPTIEQTGTDADCVNGSAVYAGWYEFYPAATTYLSNPVRARDAMSASVRVSGATITTTLSDRTAGWQATGTQSTSGIELASAEIIVEVPTSGGAELPLADFGSVRFTAATVNGAPLVHANPVRITMAHGGHNNAATSPIAKGTAFVVAWRHA